MSESLIRVFDVVKEFPAGKKNILGKQKTVLSAVNHVSFDIKKGETFGLVGESGCGKSTLARCILGLIPPTSGSVTFQGQEITGLSDGRLKPFRKEMQMVFQNPYSSFNPRMTIYKSLLEVLKVHKLYNGCEDDIIATAVSRVHLPCDYKNRYPHQFSGGQLQRFAIARALLTSPKFIIADEAVSSLDVSIQAQILNLLMELKNELNLTILFVAHDLSVVEYVSDNVAVMYLGQIVEIASVDRIYNHARHPYTNALISAIPVPDPELRTKKELLEGDIQSPIGIIQGCRFAPRCKFVQGICKKEAPVLKDIDNGHYVSCHMVK